MSRLDDGGVELALRRRWRLVPTLRAAQELSRKWGGFHHLEQALVVRNLDAYVDVVVAGAKVPAEEREAVEAEIWIAGLIVPGRHVNPALFDPLVGYLRRLQYGGRPFPEEPEGNAAGG